MGRKEKPEKTWLSYLLCKVMTFVLGLPSSVCSQCPSPTWTQKSSMVSLRREHIVVFRFSLSAVSLLCEKVDGGDDDVYQSLLHICMSGEDGGSV